MYKLLILPLIFLGCVFMFYSLPKSLLNKSTDTSSQWMSIYQTVSNLESVHSNENPIIQLKKRSLQQELTIQEEESSLSSLLNKQNIKQNRATVLLAGHRKGKPPILLEEDDEEEEDETDDEPDDDEDVDPISDGDSLREDDIDEDDYSEGSANGDDEDFALPTSNDDETKKHHDPTTSTSTTTTTTTTAQTIITSSTTKSNVEHTTILSTTIKPKLTTQITNPITKLWKQSSQSTLESLNCAAYEFRCASGDQCVNWRFRCDQFAHCRDKSDEFDCVTCDPIHEFKCYNGSCISRKQVCNGLADCSYGEEEFSCPVKRCDKQEFMCQNGHQCLNKRFRCDGTVQCLDGSDEQNCIAECKLNELRCSLFKCISYKRKCDGVRDCEDGRDEVGCVDTTKIECNSTYQFKCKDSSLCIAKVFVCDGENDCKDGSDEWNCGCQANQFTCRNGQCIDAIKKCDHRKDCLDASDEYKCDSCNTNQFQCANGDCIHKSLYCNGQIDCRDESDEIGCANHNNQTLFQSNNIRVYPSRQTVQIGQTTVFRCRDESEARLPVYWTFPSKFTHPNRVQLERGRLTIHQTRLDDAGMYICNTKYEKAIAFLTIQPDFQESHPINHITQRRNACRAQGRFACESTGKCISSALVCDGQTHCEDSSDERDCESSAEEDCQSYQFQCIQERKCISRFWLCDGEPDCSDGSDEADCVPPLTGASSSCEFTEFACADGQQCIPKSYQCDTQFDCLDQSDEIGCVEPTIVQSPQSHMIAAEGSNVSIICRAVGTPTPVINWRHNWNQVTARPKVKMTSVNGLGTLVISSLQSSDAGSWTCEAVNTKGHRLAPYDTDLVVKSKHGVCLPPTFNDDAKITEQCIKCFCFGITSTCYSSPMYYVPKLTKEPLTLTLLQYDTRNEEYLVAPGAEQRLANVQISHNPANAEFMLDAEQLNSLKIPHSHILYWKLPAPFRGNLLGSYGGFISFTIKYVTTEKPEFGKEADLIIVGESMTAHTRLAPGAISLDEISVSIQLVESRFTRTRIGQALSREQFMMLLRNVKIVYIRAKLDDAFFQSKLMHLELDSASEAPSKSTNESMNAFAEQPLKQARFVEKCSCPLGYEGESCENCSDGFVRINNGRYLGICTKNGTECNCNGNSARCENGICLNCVHHTEGDSCEKCVKGYYGDPRRGLRCQRCPCPSLTNSSEQVPTCRLDSNDEPICTSCPIDTEGDRCDKCAYGYEGNPFTGCKPKMERSFNTLSLSTKCPHGNLRCFSSGKCIPLSARCDGKPDCAQGEDEQGCNSIGEIGSADCDPIGSLSPKPSPTTGLCECKPHVTGNRCNQCKVGSFHLTLNGCTDCFCFGLTHHCEKLEIRLESMELPLSLENFNVVQWNSAAPSNPIDVSLQPLPMASSVPSLTIKFPASEETLYWRLPQEFLGNKISSYGGFLTYTVHFEQSTSDYIAIHSHPDILFEGNGRRLIVRNKGLITPSQVNRLQVHIIESSFLTEAGDGITRNELLRTLAKLNRILIKATYSKESTRSSIAQISMDVEINELNKLATLRPQFFGRQAVVSNTSRVINEICACPPGYLGNSCERCDVGHYKSGDRCIPCKCNGHSSSCEADTGRCLNCAYNSEGDSCDRCKAGFEATRRRGFFECVAQISDASNEKFISSGSSCGCNVAGTLQPVCNPSGAEGKCQCRQNVEGERCDRCKPNHFNLDASNPLGCSACFCSNVTNVCRESALYSAMVTLQGIYANAPQLTDRYGRVDVSRWIQSGTSTTSSTDKQFSFSRFDLINQTLFWSLPGDFLGNRLTSYGGELIYNQRVQLENIQSGYFQDSDVEISGAGLVLFHVNTPQLTPAVAEQYRVPLKEGEWQALSPQSDQIRLATREDMLKVLADVQSIVIRASFHQKMKQTSIWNIRMTKGSVSDNSQSNKLLSHIEQCICPPGYEGSSCELCSSGFSRENGRCIPCSCNFHSETCDIKNGVCNFCKHNTAGSRCEQCAPGYYGDATRGTPEDCTPCPCPLTLASNRFSDICYADSDGRPTCSACPVGYIGRNCEQCAPDFIGNPLIPGDSCKPLNGSKVASIKVQVQPSQIQVQPNQHVRLRCAVYGLAQSETPSIVWSRQNGLALPTGYRELSQGILEFFLRSQEDAGVYNCRVGENSVSSAMVILQDAGPIEQQSPRVRIDPRSASVSLGAPVKLSCTARSEPPARIRWTRVGSDGVQHPEVRIQQNSLVITAVTQADAGDYYCIAENSLGSDSVRTYIYVQPGDVNNNPIISPNSASNLDNPGNALDVIAAPIVRMTPESQTLIQGKSGRIECIAQGQPPPRITWLKPHSQLGERHIIQDQPASPALSHSILQLLDVQLSDRGLYACRAENAGGLGQASAVVEIERREMPVIQIYPNNNQSVQLGSSALFQCRLTAGIPSPTIQWMRLDDTPLPPISEAVQYTHENPPPPLQQMPGGVLRFNKVLPEHAGRYICSSENAAGRVTADAILTITGHPQLVIRQSSPYRVSPGGPIRLDCELSGATGNSYSVYWRKLVPREGGYSNVQVPSARESSSRAYIHMNAASTDDGGFYICSANEGIGAEARLIAQQRLQVIVENLDESSNSAEVTVEERVIKIPQDGSAEVRCFVRNSQKPLKLEWIKVGGHLPTDWKVIDGVMYATNVTRENEGHYVCHGVDTESGEIHFTHKVLLMIQEGNAPRITLLPSSQTTRPGETVRTRCEAISNLPVRVHWTRLGGQGQRQIIRSMPSQTSGTTLQAYLASLHVAQQGDTLIFDKIQPEDEGSYLCTAENAAGRAEAVAEVLVQKTPSSSRTSTRQKVSYLEENVELRCPLESRSTYKNISWTFEQNPLPSNALSDGPRLIISGVKRSNEGRYICAAFNDANRMIARDYVVLVINEPTDSCNGFQCDNGECISARKRCDSRVDCSDMSDENNCDSDQGNSEIRVNVKKEEVRLGGTLALECEVVATNASKLAWQKVGENDNEERMADNVKQDGAKLVITNIRIENGGVYRCLASTPRGTVHADFMVAIQVETREAPFGTSVIIHCKSNLLTNVLSYQWRRLASALPINAHVQNSVLTIRRLNEENAGVYLCIVRNGTRKVEIPTILRVISVVPLFSHARAHALLASLPAMLKQTDITLSFRPDKPDGLILYRAQHAQRYLQTHSSAHSMHFNNFSGDFLCIELSQGHVQVRFELGNGPKVLRSHQPLSMHVWHQLKFTRLEQDATLIVNDQVPISIHSNGTSIGLDLNPLLFIGGFAPLFEQHSHVLRQTSIRSGFVGCLGELIMDAITVNVWAASRETSGVRSCDTCHTRRLQLAQFRSALASAQSQFERQTKQILNTSLPLIPLDTWEETEYPVNDTVEYVQSLNVCKNAGVCQEALNEVGFKCICAPGFSGNRCERFGGSCYPGVCGAGRCILQKDPTSSENTSRIQCDCLMGRSGSKCEKRMNIGIPRFTGVRSFASYYIPKDSARKLTVRIRFKLNNKAKFKDMLLLYSAEKTSGSGDFVALALRESRLQMQFNTGSGTGIVTSDPLPFPQLGWTHVLMQRQFSEGSLSISSSNTSQKTITYVGRAPGRTKGSSLRLPMFVGGIDEQLVHLPSTLQGLSSFSGCISQLEMNDQPIDMISHAVDSSNVRNCAESSICADRPCENDGICVEESRNNRSTKGYYCVCKDPFSGDHCEHNGGFCAINRPCQNQGVCMESSKKDARDQFTKGGYKCCCAIGYTGAHCEITEHVSQPTCAQFDGNSFLALDRKLLPHNSTEEEEVVEFTFRTLRFNGLIFYQGDPELEDRDYLLIALFDGHLEAIWELGSGPGIAKSEEPLNDGRHHHVIFKRKGSEGQLVVDISNPIFGHSVAGLTQLNADSDIYLGGYPEINNITTQGRSLTGFSGIIGNIRVQNSKNLDLYNSAKLTCNVRPCNERSLLR